MVQIRDLERELEVIDKALARERVSIPARPLQAIGRVLDNHHIKAVIMGPSGPSPLLLQIEDWYRRRYGDRVLMDLKIGEMPMILRDTVYYLRFPVVYGRSRLSILKYVEHLTEDMARSLSQDELWRIADTFMNGFLAFQCFTNLRGSTALKSDKQRQFVSRALHDIHSAVSVLKGARDVQGAMILAQQAAEKFMKAALLDNGYTVAAVKKRFNHGVKSLADELRTKHMKFTEIGNAAAALGRFDMALRYEDKGYTEPAAVIAIQHSVHICSFIGNQWELDQERGGVDLVFQPGKFYTNSMRLNYRCVSVEADANGRKLVKLALLDNAGVDAILTQDAKYAFYYVEITDPNEIKRLEDRYRTVILATPRHADATAAGKG